MNIDDFIIANNDKSIELISYIVNLNNSSIIDFDVKSVQEFKSKNEYEIITANTQINNFNDFNEIFYCDCKKCFNTLRS